MPYIDTDMIWMDNRSAKKEQEVRAKIFKMVVNTADQLRPVDTIIKEYKNIYPNYPDDIPCTPKCSPESALRRSRPMST